MKITSSYQVKIHRVNHALDATVNIYRNAVKYLIPIIVKYYDDINQLSSKDAVMYIEKLVHGTSSRKAVYHSFDKRFYKFPSYYRRAAISNAIAHVKSCMELKDLQENYFMDFNPDVYPVFFRGNSFKHIKDKVFAIKVYKDNDWVWLSLQLDKSNLRYLYNNTDFDKLSAPVLARRHHGWSLRFAYDSEVKQKYVKDNDIKIAMGIDLGLNTDATCSVIDVNGTVCNQKFINCLQQKDRLYHLLNKIKKLQKAGNRYNSRLWSYVKNYNKDIAIRVTNQIIDFAVNNNVQVIVFENLSNLKPSGSKKQKIALWRKRDIQKRVEHKAKRYGIRVSYICAKNTSRLAFDGSGIVTRGQEAGFANNELCRFQNNKIYNCDLSASKNIAARYFLRVLQKTSDESHWSVVLANVPELSARTKCTLFTLINYHAVSKNILNGLSDNRISRKQSHAA